MVDQQNTEYLSRLNTSEVDQFHFSPNQMGQIEKELTDACAQLEGIQPAVSFFGSSRIKRPAPAYQFSKECAQQVSAAGFNVISGGGPGIMEAVNCGAQAGGSRSIGLNIVLPGQREPKNRYQDISVFFQHFFTRKLMFVEFASAFVALPGGFGTLEEVLECITLIQTRKARPIPVILAGKAFWEGMMSWFRDTLLASGTITKAELDLIHVIDTPNEVCECIRLFHETNR